MSTATETQITPPTSFKDKQKENQNLQSLIDRLQQGCQIDDSNPELLRHSIDGEHKFRKGWFTLMAGYLEILLYELFPDKDPLENLETLETEGRIEELSHQEYSQGSSWEQQLRTLSQDDEQLANAVKGNQIDQTKVQQIPAHPTCENLINKPINSLGFKDIFSLIEYFQSPLFKRKPLVQLADIEAMEKAIDFVVARATS